LIESKGVFREEGNVDDILPRLQHGFERVEAHEPRHRVEHEIEVFDQRGDGGGIGQIRLDHRNTGVLRLQLADSLRADIDGGDLKRTIGREIDGHGATHETCTKDNDFHFLPLREAADIDRTATRPKAQAAMSPFSRGRSESAKAVDEADGHALV